MKYALVTTTYAPQRDMVMELYLAEDEFTWHNTITLSKARIWDTFDEAADFLKEEMIADHKIVLIKEEDLFEARLKGK